MCRISSLSESLWKCDVFIGDMTWHLGFDDGILQIRFIIEYQDGCDGWMDGWMDGFAFDYVIAIGLFLPAIYVCSLLLLEYLYSDI